MRSCRYQSLTLLVAATVTAVVATFSAPAFAQSPQDVGVAETGGALEGQVKQLHQLMRERQAAEQAHQRETEQVQQQVDRLRADVAESREAHRNQRQSVETLAAEQAELQAERQRLEGELANIGAAAAPIAQQMRDRVARGIPFRRTERTQTLEHLVATLNGDDPLQQAEGLTGLWTLLGEELRLSTSIDFWNDTVDLPDGRRKHAYIARLGLVQQTFVSEDGQSVGLAGLQDELPWHTTLSEREGRQVRDAASIFQQQQPPQFTPVPLALPTDGGEE